MSDPPYEWDDKPKGISWIDKLNATQAIAQCIEWQLQPAENLEENRCILKNKVKGPPKPTPTPSKANEGTDQTPNPLDMQSLQTIVAATAEAVGRSVASALLPTQRNDTPDIIKEIAASAPICSGTDTTSLLSFLKKLNQITRLGLADNKQILICLLSKTSHQLQNMWIQALQANTQVNQLIPDIVNTFLPERAKQQLITQSVYRVQGQSESLNDFIMSVKDAAEILLPENTDILEIILTGINSPTRARLAGFPAPTRLSDLLQLIPRLEVIRQLETQSHPVRQPDHTQPAPQHNYRPSNTRYHNTYVPRFPFRPNPQPYHQPNHFQPRNNTADNRFRPVYNNNQSNANGHTYTNSNRNLNTSRGRR